MKKDEAVCVSPSMVTSGGCGFVPEVDGIGHCILAVSVRPAHGSQRYKTVEFPSDSTVNAGLPSWVRTVSRKEFVDSFKVSIGRGKWVGKVGHILQRGSTWLEEEIKVGGLRLWTSRRFITQETPGDRAY